MKKDIVFQGKMTDQTNAERKVFGQIEGKSQETSLSGE